LPPGSGVDQALCDYVSFSQISQASALNSGHFFRASYQVDGNVRDWSDQKDGPALQSLAFVEAWPFLNGNAQETARMVAQRNLEETVNNWPADAQMFGPWEDVRGSSFFALPVGRAALDEERTFGARPRPWGRALVDCAVVAAPCVPAAGGVICRLQL
jgi:glucoamylase